MSAIAGLWNFGGRPGAADSCRRMLRAQQLYGPDDERVWSEGALAIGRRLYRLLPEDRFDRQPVLSADGRFALVADLRIDNRDELCDALGVSADRKGLPDSAILLHALIAWGEGAADRLLGDFAFAFWNGETLLLGRDYMGNRPLHFHRGSGFVAFASMPRGLHVLEEVPERADNEAVANFLALLPETGTETFFEGVEKVQAGHVLRITPDRTETKRYWNPSSAPLLLRSPGEYEEAVRAEMDRAVAVRLRGADGVIASHLSAGLDSSTVTATAARLLAGTEGRILAYTAVPATDHAAPAMSETILDEGPLAAEVAALYPNIEHIRILSSGGSPLAGLERYHHAAQRPLLNLCNGVWTQAIAQDARRRGARVLLTGQAGNMSISFDGMTALPEMLRHGRLIALARAAAGLARNGIRLSTLAAQIIGPFMPLPLWQALSRLRGKGAILTDYTALRPELAERITNRACERGLDVSYRPRSEAVEARLWALSRVDRGNHGKGMLGGWGMDLRDPTADRRLVELCLAIPQEQFLAGGRPRSLARRAFADRLPASIVQERRKGLQAVDWHVALTAARPELRVEVQRLGRVPGAGEVLDIAAMEKLVENWPTGEWQDRKVVERYRLALLRGTSAGHFLRRANGSNA